MKRIFLPIATIALVLLAVNLLAGAPASPADASSSASLTGTVKFQGAAPKPTRIDMSSDPNCLKAHTSPPMTEDYVVGANGSLQNVVVYISDGMSGGPFQPPAEPAVFEQKGCMYKPHVLALQANQKLDVVNSDATTHNIHPSPNNNREWNKTQPHGMPLEETFAREEIAILVKCNVHPWMKGYIAVFKHPYFAVTDQNGNFDIKNLPAGSYTVTAWHEKLGVQTQKITVANGQAATLDFSFKQ